MSSSISATGAGAEAAPTAKSFYVWYDDCFWSLSERNDMEPTEYAYKLREEMFDSAAASNGLFIPELSCLAHTSRCIHLDADQFGRRLEKPDKVECRCSASYPPSEWVFHPSLLLFMPFNADAAKRKFSDFIDTYHLTRKLFSRRGKTADMIFPMDLGIYRTQGMYTVARLKLKATIVSRRDRVEAGGGINISDACFANDTLCNGNLSASKMRSLVQELVKPVWAACEVQLEGTLEDDVELHAEKIRETTLAHAAELAARRELAEERNCVVGELTLHRVCIFPRTTHASVRDVTVTISFKAAEFPWNAKELREVHSYATLDGKLLQVAYPSDNAWGVKGEECVQIAAPTPVGNGSLADMLAEVVVDTGGDDDDVMRAVWARHTGADFFHHRSTLNGHLAATVQALVSRYLKAEAVDLPRDIEAAVVAYVEKHRLSAHVDLSGGISTALPLDRKWLAARITHVKLTIKALHMVRELCGHRGQLPPMFSADALASISKHVSEYAQKVVAGIDADLESTLLGAAAEALARQRWASVTPPADIASDAYTAALDSLANFKGEDVLLRMRNVKGNDVKAVVALTLPSVEPEHSSMVFDLSATPMSKLAVESVLSDSNSVERWKKAKRIDPADLVGTKLAPEVEEKVHRKR